MLACVRVDRRTKVQGRLALGGGSPDVTIDSASETGRGRPARPHRNVGGGDEPPTETELRCAAPVWFGQMEEQLIKENEPC
jgi:hypothetical protein